MASTDQIAPNEIFSWKFFLRADPKLWGCHFRAQNDPFVLSNIFLVQTIITFIYLLALFIVQNFKKILTANPKLWGCTIFGPKMVHLPQTIFFWKKILLSFSSTYYRPLSLCKIFKKFLQQILTPFLGPKQPIWLNEKFFSENLLISLVPFIHAYLHAKNQSQILVY